MSLECGHDGYRAPQASACPRDSFSWGFGHLAAVIDMARSKYDAKSLINKSLRKTSMNRQECGYREGFSTDRITFLAMQAFICGGIYP